MSLQLTVFVSIMTKGSSLTFVEFQNLLI